LFRSSEVYFKYYKGHSGCKCDIGFKMVKEEDGRPVFFTNEEWDRLALYLIGNNTRYRENVIIPRVIGPVKIKTREEKMVEAAFESCAFKTVMSCVAGKLVINLIGLNCIPIRRSIVLTCPIMTENNECSISRNVGATPIYDAAKHQKSMLKVDTGHKN
jgi:hypothetical protein